MNKMRMSFFIRKKFNNQFDLLTILNPKGIYVYHYELCLSYQTAIFKYYFSKNLIDKYSTPL